MIGARLFSILRSLDDYEFQKFEEMVVSPYFNKDKRCVELLRLLKPFYPNFKDPILTKDYLFFSLFPDKKRVTSTINIVMTKLTGFAREHLVRQKLEERFLLKNHLILECYLDRGLRKQFQTHYNDIQSRYGNLSKKDAMNFLEEFLIAQDYYNFSKMEKGRNKHIDPSTVSNPLDTYFLIQKLQIECEKEVYKDINATFDLGKEVIELSLSENLEQLSINQSIPKSHINLLYIKMLNCIKNPINESVFDDFLDTLVNQGINDIKKEEYNQFLTHSINYCIDKILMGKMEYYHKLFIIYKSIVNFKLIYQNGFLNLNRVKNIISCAVQVGEIEWAREFLESQKDRIKPEHLNNAYNFYSALLHFYSEQYDEAIDFLNRIEYDIDKYYFLNRITFLLRCYYENNSDQAFSNLYSTFRSNLSRNKKLTTKEKQSFGTFTRLIYFVHQYRSGFSKKTKSQLTTMINEAQMITHKKWLLSKLDQLK